MVLNTVNGHSKKKGKKAKNVTLVAGTLQTLSNIFFLLISMTLTHIFFNTSVRHLWQLKTAVFLHWYLTRALLLTQSKSD
jgi:hypothetical protein